MYFLCLGGQAAASAARGADGQDVQAGPSDAGQNQDIATEPEAELPTSPPTYSGEVAAALVDESKLCIFKQNQIYRQ